MIDWSVEIDALFVGDHSVTKVWQRHLVHDVDHETLDWYVHILGQVHLIQFVEHLLKAIEEGKAAHYADGFLRPNIVVILKLGMLELTFESSRTLLIEEQHASIIALALRSCQDEVDEGRSRSLGRFS